MPTGARLAAKSRSARRAWPGWLSAWLLGLLLLVALVLVLRRTGGGLNTPLTHQALFLSGLITAAASIAIRVLQSPTGSDREPLKSFWRVSPTVAAVLIASSLSIPATTAGGLFLLWICTALGELVGQLISQSRANALDHPVHIAADPSPLLHPVLEPKHDMLQEPSDPPVGEQDDNGLWQRFSRSRDEQGNELLSGWLRVDFAPGERTKFAHVAFCPPLLRKAECEVELDDDRATVTVAQVLPQGARFELKLRQAAVEATSIPLQWVAYEPATSTLSEHGE